MRDRVHGLMIAMLAIAMLGCAPEIDSPSEKIAPCPATGAVHAISPAQHHPHLAILFGVIAVLAGALAWQLRVARK